MTAGQGAESCLSCNCWVSLGLTVTRAGPLPTWMKAMDLGNRAYRSSSLTVTVTRP